MPGYELLASPTLHPGQIIRAHVIADSANQSPVKGRLVIHRYNGNDLIVVVGGEVTTIAPGADVELASAVAGRGGEPVHAVGLQIEPADGEQATVYLDWLTWDGTPNTTFDRPGGSGVQWHRSWVNAVDQFETRWPEPFRIVKNEGIGLVTQGGRAWTDYQIEAPVYVHLAKSAGIAVRVQGLRRYYALLLCDDGTMRLVKARDGVQTTLAERPLPWEPRQVYQLRLEVNGATIRAGAGYVEIFEVTDDQSPLLDGGIGLIVEDGTFSAHEISIGPVGAPLP